MHTPRHPRELAHQPIQPMSNKWRKDIFFVLACIGAAVGLGSIWRFPHMAYSNGGGAFLIPFIIMLALVGLPLCMLEIALGRWGGGSIVAAFRKNNPRFTWIGWWILVNSLVIVFYYCVVLAWCTQYLLYSFTTAWGEDPGSFFGSTALNLTAGPENLGGFNWPTVVALAVVWFFIAIIVRGGLPWISKALLITVPLPFVLLAVMAARSAFLPGAIDGMSYFVTPKFDALLNPSVWAAAASQTVLALGLAMGQMVAYASRKRDDTGLTRSAVAICLSVLIVSVLSGLVTFGMMGFLAQEKGVAIEDLKLESISLAFVSFPMAISKLPLAPLWGVIFFVLLIAIGLDSAFAVIEAMLPGTEELTGSNARSKLATTLCLIGFAGGLIFSARGGLYWLDIVDHWVEKFAMPSLILLECILFAWFARIDQIGEHIRKSWPAFPAKQWRFLIRYIVPIILIIVFGGRVIQEGPTQYQGYPEFILWLIGWGVFFAIIVAAIVIGWFHNKRSRDGSEDHPPRG